MLWRVTGRVDLGLELENDTASKHSDLNITTLHRNVLFEAREWGVLWRVPGRADLGLELEIDTASKHSDLNITTLHRNALFEAREWGVLWRVPGRAEYIHVYTYMHTCLGLGQAIDGAPKHSDLKRTTIV